MVNEPTKREHVYDGNCWCRPTIAFVGPDGVKVFVHRDPDDDTPLERIWPDARVVKQRRGNEVN